MEVVLDEDDRVRRYAKESLNLMRNSFRIVIEVDQSSDTQTDLIPRDSEVVTSKHFSFSLSGIKMVLSRFHSRRFYGVPSVG